jgi:parallel beta-helix repeat protein
VKLVRTGNTFKAYQSANGRLWSLINSATISMATTVYMGLAVTSHNNSALTTATFGTGGSTGTGGTTIGTGGTTKCASAPTSSLVVNVKDKGAKGDGSTDDTQAIQSAVDAVAGSGGTVLVPDGTYAIDTVTKHGINLRNNMTFRMSSGAVLKALPNNRNWYQILFLDGVSNVNIIGGTLQGERDLHQGTTGEWGYGVGINASTNIVVEGVLAKDFWGDGFFVSYGSKDIKLCSVVADRNRRQGLSIVGVDGIVVQDSVFKNTNGTWPMAGIDIEPDVDTSVNNVRIVRSQFLNNAGNGIEVYNGNHAITNVTIDANTLSGNGTCGAISLYNVTGIAITNNTIVDSKTGFFLTDGATGNVITGNTVTAPALYIEYNGAINNTISTNTFYLLSR